MKLKSSFFTVVALLCAFVSAQAQTDSADASLRCMIQMTNYDGEGAYIIVSLLDSSDQYLETLHIIGEDRDWYYEIENWWSYFGRKKRNIDGITGPTLAGGERSIIAFDVPQYAFRNQHKLRFETAVEDQPYYPSEIDVAVSDSLPAGKIEGVGYIRYARFIQTP